MTYLGLPRRLQGEGTHKRMHIARASIHRLAAGDYETLSLGGHGLDPEVATIPKRLLDNAAPKRLDGSTVNPDKLHI